MPMGSRMCSAPIWPAKTALMFSRKKLLYLKNPKYRILAAIAIIKIGFLLFAPRTVAADKADPQVKLNKTEKIKTRVKYTFQKDMKPSDASSKKDAPILSGSIC